MNESILIIDDDKKLCALLTDYMSKYGFNVSTAVHPDKGIEKLKKEKPDLIILDVMLPGKDGFEVCKEIRRNYSIPIIMLTARGEVTDRIVGLELGADDYLPKPFEPRELVARIQSIFRRSNGTTRGASIKHGQLELDLAKLTVTLDGKQLDFTSTEFEILCLFAKNPGKVMDRDLILEKIRGIDFEPFNRSIDVLISRIRQKLGDDPKRPTYFKTVWGSGYMFIEAGDQ